MAEAVQPIINRPTPLTNAAARTRWGSSRRSVVVRHDSEPRGSEQQQPVYVKVEASGGTATEVAAELEKAYRQAYAQLSGLIEATAEQ